VWSLLVVNNQWRVSWWTLQCAWWRRSGVTAVISGWSWTRAQCCSINGLSLSRCTRCASTARTIRCCSSSLCSSSRRSCRSAASCSRRRRSSSVSCRFLNTWTTFTLFFHYGMLSAGKVETMQRCWLIKCRRSVSISASISRINNCIKAYTWTKCARATSLLWIFQLGRRLWRDCSSDALCLCWWSGLITCDDVTRRCLGNEMRSLLCCHDDGCWCWLFLPVHYYKDKTSPCEL